MVCENNQVQVAQQTYGAMNVEGSSSVGVIVGFGQVDDVGDDVMTSNALCLSLALT